MNALYLFYGENPMQILYPSQPPSQTNEKKIKPSQTSPISIKSVNHNVDLEQCDVMHKQGGRNVVGP
jgi:hypothetical protein